MSMNFDFVTKYYKEDVYMMCLEPREELVEMQRWADEYYKKHGVNVWDSKEFSKIMLSLARDIEEESDFE